MPNPLDTILARLSAAEGPDRELDAEIWLETTAGATRRTRHVFSLIDAWPPYDIDETRDETGRLITVPAYTASVDAAIALAERVLPDMNTWGVERAPHKGAIAYEATVQRNNVESGHWAYFAECRSSPAIALCLATIRALRAKGGGE